jgi:Caspase domain
MAFSQGHALLVGVGEYQETSLSAPVTERDARALEKALKDPATAGYLAENVTRLSGSDASSQVILTALEALQKELKKPMNQEGTVLLFLCGHGVPGPGGSYYFLSYDAKSDERDRFKLS